MESLKNITINLLDNHTILVTSNVDGVGVKLPYYDSTDLRESALLALDQYFDKHPN